MAAKASDCEEDNVVMTSHEPTSFYPAKFWGLDYHFHVYNKMYVCDILNMKEYPQFTGAFAYNNHPIYKVDVMGVVVKKVENSKCFIYAVDDGTGIILCCCWKEDFYKQNGHLGQARDLRTLHPTLREKWTDMNADTNLACEGYSLGDLVQMKGKLKIFREKKEVVANIHKRVSDPNFQLFRISELPRLYRCRYDIPFRLPDKVLQANNQKGMASDSSSDSQMSVVHRLKAVILEYVSKSSHIVEIYLNDLLQYAKVKDILLVLNFDKVTDREKELALLFEALSLLEDEGHVTRRSDRRNLFEVLLHKSKLEGRIMNILVTDTAKPKYAEKGCHYLHILDELHRTLQYSKLKKEALLYCLQKLESQSDVIRTTHAHYLPCGD